MSSDDLAFLNDTLASQAASNNGGSGGASSHQVNGNSQTGVAIAESNQVPDLASLQPILQALKISSASEEDPENMSDEAISALLDKLDEANMVTDGLESRLDQLLGQLDGMLENLETSTAEVVEQKIELSVQEAEEGANDAKEDIVNGQIVNHKGDT